MEIDELRDRLMLPKLERPPLPQSDVICPVCGKGLMGRHFTFYIIEGCQKMVHPTCVAMWMTIKKHYPQAEL